MAVADLPNQATELILAGLKLSERELLRNSFIMADGDPPWGGRRLTAGENFLADLLADPQLADRSRSFFPQVLGRTIGEPGHSPNNGRAALQPTLDLLPWGGRLVNDRREPAQKKTEELTGQDGWPLVLDFFGRALTLLAGAAVAGAAALDERYLFTRSLDGRPIRIEDRADFELSADAVVLPRRADRVLVLGFVRTPEIMGMNQGLARLSPTINWPDWSGQVAATLKIAAWLRTKGYLALPSALGLLAANHLGALAGLGELGRQGLLITPEYGPNLRLWVIITDFPFETGRPASFGVADYCDTCQRCINECPAKALTGGHRRTGFYQWPVNQRACFDNWLEKGDPCRKCIEICPYTKEPLVGSPGGVQRSPSDFGQAP